MEISQRLTIDTPPEAVADILLSEELAAKRMAALGVSDYTHTHEGNEAVTDVRVGTDRLPDAARRFIRGGLHLTVTTSREGSAVVYSVDPHGLPGEVDLRQTLSPAASGATNCETSGNVRVKIPLVGAKLEKQAEKYVGAILRRDARLIAQVAAERN